MNMIKTALVALVATVLASTVGAHAQSAKLDNGQIVNRTHVAKVLKRHLKDPYSVRDAVIGVTTEKGYEGLIWGEHVWFCTAFNSKNGFGAYTGMSVVAVGFKLDGSSYRYQNKPSFVCQKPDKTVPFKELMAKQ